MGVKKQNMREVFRTYARHDSSMAMGMKDRQLVLGEIMGGKCEDAIE